MTLTDVVSKICKYGTPLGCSKDDEEEKKGKKDRES